MTEGARPMSKQMDGCTHTAVKVAGAVSTLLIGLDLEFTPGVAGCFVRHKLHRLDESFHREVGALLHRHASHDERATFKVGNVRTVLIAAGASVL